MKNLIYYSIGGNLQYIEILNMHLKSLSKYIDLNIDILFITDNNFIEKIKNTLDKLNLNIDNFYFFISDTSSVQKSSYSKLKIYDWTLIKNYEKIFYCDIDTIWTNNISNIFNTIVNSDDIYVSNEDGTMGGCYYNGKDFFSNEELKKIKENNVKAINFGAFGFFSKSVLIFKQIEQFMMDNLDKMNVCIEQPYGNVVLYRNNVINNSFNTLISHDHITKKTLMHFPGGPGNYVDKINKMKEYD